MAKIQIDNDYYLTTTDYGYTLCESKLGKDKDDKPKIHTKQLGFYSSLDMALRRVVHIKAHNNQSTVSLGKYIDEYKQTLHTLIDKTGGA